MAIRTTAILNLNGGMAGNRNRPAHCRPYQKGTEEPGMSEKHYVIQWKIDDKRKWITLDRKYPTLESAVETMKRKRAAGLSCEKWRIAESYTVVRYKAVILPAELE